MQHDQILQNDGGTNWSVTCNKLILIEYFDIDPTDNYVFFVCLIFLVVVCSDCKI